MKHKILMVVLVILESSDVLVLSCKPVIPVLNWRFTFKLFT
jgi:hypothetical protein